ncbi:MAG: extracellular solute-binding protein [Chloroflexi bacterium]|nr:extracellular solute-binding protein [Chloroflexota bacterium]
MVVQQDHAVQSGSAGAGQSRLAPALVGSVPVVAVMQEGGGDRRLMPPGSAGRVTRRRVVGGLGVASLGGLTAALLAACGGPASSGESGQKDVPQGRIVELRVHGQATSDGEGYDKNVAAFNERYAGKYRAIHEQITGNLYTTQETEMASGTAADLHYAHTSNLKHQEYAIKGVALQLDSFISKDKNFKLSDWPQRAQDVMKIVDGKFYGLPIRGQVSWQFLFWNRDMLKRAGIPEPTPNWTLDDLIANAKKLQQPGSSEFYPIAYGGINGFERIAAEVRRFGGEFFEVPAGAGKKCQLDTAPCQQAIKWFYDNTKSELFAPRTWAAAQFGQGKTAFLFGHLAGQRATVANNAKGAFEWTFDIVPKRLAGRRGGFLSIDMQQINSSTKSQDGSWELLKWLTNKQSGVNIALQPVGSLTPGYRKDVYCSDELLNDSRFPKSAMKANCDNFDQPETYVYPANLRLTQPGAIQEVLNKFLIDIVDLKQEPTPAILKEMTTEVQKVLDMPRL